jgi:hypothetical protein
VVFAISNLKKCLLIVVSSFCDGGGDCCGEDASTIMRLMPDVITMHNVFRPTIVLVVIGKIIIVCEKKTIWGLNGPF